MTSFGWKRKAGASVDKSTSQSFETNSKDDSKELETEGIDWISLAPKRRVISLEDAVIKSERLRNEGAVLAESERYWEAVKKWDEALHFNPLNCKIHEMKAQALMALNELYPAVTAAQKAVEMSPTWWVAHQTLGRAQLNLGEVRSALRCFSMAVHLHPADRELWEEDLMWAYSLLSQRKKAEEIEKQEVESTLTVTEIKEESENEDSKISHDVTSEPSRTNSLQTYSSSEVSKMKRTKKLKSLPQNYVVMRDK